MNPFERASTGISGLDRVLDHLRPGDNVVWQVDSIEDYRHFVSSFVRQALLDNKRMVYMRFGQHPPVLEMSPDINVYYLNPQNGFEAFSTEVHSIASAEGEGVYYVFDSLSDLLSAWATDLMIGNFFRVTCPYLFELNTIAYFAVLRNRNSYKTIARIRETTQLLLDVYREDERYYIHPLKVWNRYSPTMFLPHLGVNDQFVPVTSSGEAARLVARFERQKAGDSARKLDYWDLVFMEAEDLLKRLENGESVGEAEEAEMVEKLCRMMVGRDDRILRLAHTFFTLKDLLRIRTHLIGTGFLGGKTVGMLLARAILRKSRDVNWRQWMEPHDSFFVGSDVYYTYLVENGCWKLRLEQKQEENYFSTAATLREEMLNGRLPDTISEQIQEMLEYFGQAPIIVRSSSLLEDGFGNAFAGKYESIFCVNQGSPQERYNLFEKAVKTVYASTMNEDALAYRMQRGLAQNDEQMALLVQRVSGSHRGFYFFPDIAGVALSRNPYAWREDIDIGAGMMRLVLGLGTRAVDRVDDDYPRIIALDKPLLRPDNTQEEIQRFSQHKVDLLDTVQNELDTVPLIKVADILKTTPRLWEYFAVRDHAATRKLREMGYVSSEAWTLTFEKLLVNTPFAKLMKNMLQDLEEAYRYPVDIEFTANLSSDAKLQINLLQCRPLQTVKNSLSQGSIEQVEPDKVFFSARNSFMGPDCSITATRLVYVRHDQYVELPLNEKYQIARLIGKINRQLKTQRQSVIFIGPGRWGTSTPSLGVPVSFAEICNAQVLVEVASPNNGVMPELSFGTHFFQDLVETGIIYVALFPDREGTVFNDKLIDQFPNRLSDLLPDEERWQEVITLIETDQKKKLVVDIDLQSRVTKCYFHDAK